MAIIVLPNQVQVKMRADEFNRLLSRISVSDKAFEELYDYYYPRIVLHIKMKYHNVDASDIAHEFFLNLIRTKSFKYIKHPSSWVYACCDNIIKKSSNREFEEISEITDILCADYLCDTEGKESNLSDFFNSKETDYYLSCLTNEEDKKIIYLYYWMGYTLREIAGIMKLKNATVKQRFSRAMKKIKKFAFECSQIDKKDTL